MSDSKLKSLTIDDLNDSRIVQYYSLEVATLTDTYSQVVGYRVVHEGYRLFRNWSGGLQQKLFFSIYYHEANKTFPKSAPWYYRRTVSFQVLRLWCEYHVFSVRSLAYTWAPFVVLPFAYSYIRALPLVCSPRSGIEWNKDCVETFLIFIGFVVIFMIIETMFGTTTSVRDLYLSLLLGWTA